MGLPPPDPHSLYPLSSIEFVAPPPNPGYATDHNNGATDVLYGKEDGVMLKTTCVIFTQKGIQICTFVEIRNTKLRPKYLRSQLLLSEFQRGGRLSNYNISQLSNDLHKNYFRIFSHFLQTYYHTVFHRCCAGSPLKIKKASKKSRQAALRGCI
jgi:hypothetical protein